MKNLITEHLDIWTSARIPKSNGGRGNRSTNGQTIYGIKKLRELILELAVRGKLVPQDPNDEPAGLLLDEINRIRKNLKNKGFSKTVKPFSVEEIDKILFDLPKSWIWTNLENLALINPRNEFTDEKEASFIPMPLITSSYKGEHLQELKIWRDIKQGYTHFADGDIGIAKITPCYENGKGAIFSDLKNGVGAGTTELHIARLYLKIIDARYIYIFLKSPFFINEGISKMTGTAGQKRLPKEYFAKAPLPLPPIKEQHRIVAKVDELMALCDQLEKQETENTETHQALVKTLLSTLTSAAEHKEFTETWNRIKEHFDILFTTEESIDQLKQTILQLAVMGKLVEQDPKAEPASELLKKIAKEKEKLIKEGKIKKQKPLPVIKEDEKPFDLPDGWEWVKLVDIGTTQTGTTPPTNHPEYYGAGYPFIKPSDILHSVIGYNNEQITDLGLAHGRLIPANSALMVCIGGSIGKVGYIDRACSCNQQINVISPLAGIDGMFIAYWMKSPFFQQEVLSRAPKTTLPILSKGKWEVIDIPIPPLNEQQRIVSKVNELMALCDTLKSGLNSLQETKTTLADVFSGKVAA